jgi:uroporphyrin-III C-methyltransferase/precorrin-2 dehydrogenase/sirohydrochlorin ferrochelatase
MNERRPALLEALVSLYEHRRTDGADPRAADALGRGMVALVGAGPGDPDLVTRRAADRLRAADVVFFDGLVAPPILSLAPHARHVSVARRAGQKALAQDDVAAMMIEAALDGQRVVRLKSGDPFVFARGGEEVEALARAGVPFEIVPGITSALAAPALARIPVTHRGIASAFVVISGHARAAYEPVLASVAPGAATVVVLMGMAERAGIGGCLVAAGWPDETPVAIVTSASRPDEHVWVGTIARLAEPDPLGLPDGPSVIVVGDVVRAARAEMAAGEEPATRSNANGRRARGAAADAIAAHDPRAGEPVRRTGAAGASGDETTAGVLEVQGHQRS